MAEHTDPHSAFPIDPDTPTFPAGPLHTRVWAVALVGVGGVFGAPLRYQLGVWFPHSAGGWPVTTFAINIVGALALGWLLEGLTRLGSDHGWRRRARLGVGTGFLGAFTTYSTLAVDTGLLLRGHHWSTAATYAVGTVLAGLVATTVGIAAGAWVRAQRAERL
ncbi:CrcB family protein [Nocardia zapadnayensis]|uniref:fluoride efflux transporter FluC n=1 Tax=Nocardia rhamnosiphila TaxID=426716 RepID=UPI002246AD29|nr:CrcB family protein [Nocardia zapadnayensis]MCX0271570.1 CrcB family protein [Nocardia zapadnayensis]